MEYKLRDEYVVYEKGVPDVYVLSNGTFTLEVKRGVPYRLFSSRDGLLLRFGGVNLGVPDKSVLWPNGCTFRFGDASWSFVTSTSISSILWHLKNVDRVFVEFEAPLEKVFKVPFGETFELRKPLRIDLKVPEINISDVVSIEIIGGKIEEFLKNDKNSKSFLLKLRSNEDKDLKIRFSIFGGQKVNELEENDRYREFLKRYTPSGLGELERTLMIFALHTAMCNWKDFGGVKAFSAGLNYSFPPRTYFRDSFWTCLGLVDVVPGLVREQILVLANGVHEDGCPSGVMFLTEEEREILRELKSKNSLVRENVRYDIDWWSDHHDSGFLFVLLLSSYVHTTGDFSILKEEVDGESIVNKVKKIMDYSEKFVVNDLFKKPFDCRDWSDNVFRNGFVTYDAALHVAAMRETSSILLAAGMIEESEKWRELYLRRKKKFNEVLFDEGRGYFLDFVGDYVEDHLSLDTVVALIFDVAEESKAVSSLTKMEELLETRNNEFQPYGDWGVMNVWPGYKKRTHLFGKSVFPYRYHNGSCWPYLCCAYAVAKHRYGLDPSYPLLSWWKYSLEKGWVNLVEYYSPCYGRGSLNQAWSSYAAAAIRQMKKEERRW